VRAVAQRLILALSATAKLYQRSPIQVKLPAVLIEQLKIPFDVNASVALHGDFCGHGAFLV
jgi:hypothetical protein